MAGSTQSAPAQYYGAQGSSQAAQPGSVGAAFAQDQSDKGNTETRDASGTGSVIGGNASAKTAMGGGSGGGGGGGGSGGGSGGYSLGASIADDTTISTGFSGRIDAGQGSDNKHHFGDHNINVGGTQSNGISGKVLAIGAAVLGGIVLLVMLFKRRAA